MKKFVKTAFAFVMIFLLNIAVEAKDYTLNNKISGIYLENAEVGTTIYVPIDEYYAYLESEEKSMYTGSVSTEEMASGYAKFYVTSYDETLLYMCTLTGINYPTESNITLEENLEEYNVMFEIVLNEDSTLTVNQNQILRLDSSLYASKNTTILVNGTLHSNYDLTSYGSVSGNIYGETNYVVETPVYSVTANGNGTVSINISDPVDGVNYVIYRSTSKNGKYSKVTTLTNGLSSYRESKLKVGSNYYYKVRAYRKVNTKAIYSSYTTIKGVKVTLNAPQTTATSRNKTSIVVKWDKVSGATGYVVYRATSKTGKYTAIKTTTSTSFVNSGLTIGKTYYYKVRPYRTISKTKYYGTYSSVVIAKPMVGTPTYKATSYDYNSNKITITKVTGAAGYAIYRSENKDSGYTLLTRTTKTTYYDKDLDTGKVYYYKVKAYATVSKTRKYGLLGEVVSSTPTLKTPAFTVTPGARDVLEINVNEVNGATGYKIYKLNGENYELFLDLTDNTACMDYDLTLGSEHTYKVVAYRTVGENTYESKESEAVTGTVKPIAPTLELGKLTYDDTEVYIYNLRMLGTPLYEVTEEDEVSVSVYRRTSKTDYELLETANINDKIVTLEELSEATDYSPYYDRIMIVEDEGVKILYYISSNLTLKETYSFKVNITINGITSEYSNVVTDKIILETPGIESISSEYNKILVAFDYTDGADGYELYRATSKKGKYTRVYDGEYNYAEVKGSFNKTYYFKVRAYKFVSGKKVYSSYSTIDSCRTGVKPLDDYPLVLDGEYSDAKIKSVSLAYKRVSGNYVYYTFKVNFKSTYSTKKTTGKFTVYYYDKWLDHNYTYTLTTTIPKGTKKNWSETWTIKIPKTSVYYMFK